MTTLKTNSTTENKRKNRRKKRNKLEELEAQGQTALRLDQDPETD